MLALTQAWVLDGSSPAGYSAAGALPQVVAGGAQWQLDVTSAPLLIKLK